MGNGAAASASSACDRVVPISTIAVDTFKLILPSSSHHSHLVQLSFSQASYESPNPNLQNFYPPYQLLPFPHSPKMDFKNFGKNLSYVQHYVMASSGAAQGHHCSSRDN